uniref:Heat shock protein 70 n=1 Tax=Meloidogyne hapla TaxID=6305 RepID=A0A1I8BMW6_MELHA
MNRFLRPSFNRFPVKRLSNALRGPVIGINFGFTNSSVAILEDRKAKVLKNDEGSILTPSVVAFTKDDEILVGAPAIRQSVLNSQNTIFGIKRLIGRKYDEKETAENYLNKKVSNAIITVPAYFNDSQRKLIKEAGRLANLRISNIFNESAVAAFAYNLDIGSNDLIAICDYGGTFDISFLKKNEKYFEVKSANAHPFSCGIDFDNVIVNYLVDEFKREKGIDLVKDPIAMQRLHEAAEKAKCILSYSDQTKIILPNITTDSNGLKHFEYKLS